MALQAMRKKPETERLEARITSEKKMLLRHAADLSGRSLTDFIVSSAYENATRIIQEHEQLRLSFKDRDIFIQAVLNPPKPSKNILKAVKKYQKDVFSSDE